MTVMGRLHQGLIDLGLDVVPEREARLNAYLVLMCKWNRIHNLTAIRDLDQMVSQHVLDSLVVLPHCERMATLVDVGSGAGLPGIPLAIVRPELRVTLIESNRKKCSFLQQAKIELELDNVSIHCVRVEDYKPDCLFDGVISRAFSELAEFICLAGHLLAPEGRMLAMKGVYPQEEVAGLPTGWRVQDVVSLTVPDLSAQRHLIVIEKAV